jgi:hypothetical protein
MFSLPLVPLSAAVKLRVSASSYTPGAMFTTTCPGSTPPWEALKERTAACAAATVASAAEGEVPLLESLPVVET